ncbi:hypothetical protein [Sphingomonas sp. PvP018]|uniref:hypothetical protein n=1 Tax=Sphingomonas sp. PvP018 TaxID=2817852 RepID=UPI001AEB6AFD|nr:hypothetical protein [Sphingomonas sp. PvP018]MBP2515541.1 hypothetical protein [Sphingomonas sp. PvP018]
MTDKFADEVEENLSNWRKGLFEKIPVGGLLARSPVAHKWKSPFRPDFGALRLWLMSTSML